MDLVEKPLDLRKYPAPLTLARWLWPLPAALALLLLFATLPTAIESAYNNWQSLGAYPAVSDLVAYRPFALYLLVLRHLAALAFWLAGLFVYRHVGLRNGRFSAMGLFTALLLCLFPGPFILETLDAAAPLPRPWDAWFEGANQLLAFLALAAFVLFFYFFPDGRVAPRQLRWAPPAFVVALLLALYALLNLGADWTWLAFMLLFLSALFIGLAAQLYRYHRLADPIQRRRTKWVLIGMACQPFLFLLGFGFGESAWGSLIGLHARIILSALLPLSLLAAMLRRGLWGVFRQRSGQKWTWISAAVLALSWIGALAFFMLAQPAAAGQAMTIAPLPPVAAPKPVVIDNDMDPNDWMAILYLLQRPEVEVLAITIPGTGETHCEPGVRNALGLVALAADSQVPVACGREIPLQGHHAFPAAWREMADNPKGGRLPAAERNPAAGRTAPELLVETIANAPQEVTLVTLGPLTNIAEAIQLDPTILDDVAQIYVMGGALEVLGNVGFSGVGIDNHVAEWNVYVDPLALEVVLASGAPVTLVPLDATNLVPIDLDFYFRLAANRHTPEAELVYDLLSGQLDFVASGGYYFWDPLTAALAVDESLGYIKEGKIWVSTASGSNSGLTRLLNQGYPARYAKWADDEAFEADFLRTINQP